MSLLKNQQPGLPKMNSNASSWSFSKRSSSPQSASTISFNHRLSEGNRKLFEALEAKLQYSDRLERQLSEALSKLSEALGDRQQSSDSLE